MVYDDLGRPKKAITASGDTTHESWTTTDYYDAGRYVVVKSDLETKGDGKKVATQFYDQLGRVRLTKTLENAATQSATNETDGIKVQTRYATSSGYTYQLTSNPYRATTSGGASGETTMGWTRSKSANTGRHSEVETFAGATVPQPFLASGYNTASTGMVTTDKDADRAIVTDQTGKRRISKTNSLGQLTDVWEIVGASDSWTTSVAFPGSVYSGVAYGYQTSYQYDTLNNLTHVDQGAQDRDFTYSSLSRLLSAANPESGTIEYEYDSNGNLTKKTDAREIETTYAYDALNRVTARDYTDSTPDVDYTYGTTAPKIGRLTKVESSVSTTEYTSFDILGRVTGHKQTTDNTDYATAYAYNLSGAMIEQTYPSGRKVQNILDPNGDLEMVKSRKNSNSGYWNYANNFTYNAAGAVTSMQLGNGRWESTAFNSRLQSTQIALGTTLGAVDNLQLDYTYGTTANNGNVQTQKITVKRPSLSDLVFDQTYTYDSLNRLQVAEEKTGTTTNWKQTFTFDRYGNRNFDEANTTTLPKNCGTTPNFVVCTSDVPVVNPAVSTTNNRLTGYTFDAAGNVITDAEGRTFTYDAENKQTEAKNSSNATLGTYFFDGDGKRVKKVVPSTGETTIFVYDAGGKLVAEYSTIVAATNEAKVQYLTNDNLGTPRINTDRDGNVVSRSDYMPYGENIVSLGGRSSTEKYVANDVRQGFTGYINDDETELDFAEARYYKDSHGRFTSPDPLYLEQKRLIDPQKINLYVYTRNNPLTFVDQDGLDVTVKDKTKDKTGDDEYLRLVNSRKGQQFQLGYDKKNRLSIVDSNGKALSKEDLAKLGNSSLSNSEKELFNAVTDKDNHATVTIVRNDPKILTFGAYKGDGKNTVDVGDLAVLSSSNPKLFTASNVALHETLEAYTSARLKSGFDPSHNYVNTFFPGLENRTGATNNSSPDGSNIVGQTLTFPIHNGGGASLDVTFEFVTPIPVKSLPKAKQKFRPFNITKTKENP